MQYECQTEPFHPVFPKNQKLNNKGKTTIYVRVTIDGLKDEFSSGIQGPS
jgi:hypothetical protein